MHCWLASLGIIGVHAFCLVGAWQDGLVLDDLEAAKRAYDAAVQAVEDAQQALQQARDDVPAARDKLHAEIIKAAKKGARQIDLVKATGYQRERIRQILRAAGITPNV